MTAAEHVDLSRGVATTAGLLATAGEDDALGRPAERDHRIRTAGYVLWLAFRAAPHQLPLITSVLAGLGPAIRHADIRAALLVAEQTYRRAGGSATPLLAFGAGEWIDRSCADNGTDAGVVSALLALDPNELGAGRLARPGGLAVPSATAALVQAGGADDLTAVADVHAAHDRAIRRQVADIDELQRLLAGRTDAPVEAAVAELDGPPRVRAEQLLARLPTVLTLPCEHDGPEQ